MGVFNLLPRRIKEYAALSPPKQQGSTLKTDFGTGVLPWLSRQTYSTKPEMTDPKMRQRVIAHTRAVWQKYEQKMAEAKAEMLREQAEQQRQAQLDPSNLAHDAFLNAGFGGGL